MNQFMDYPFACMEKNGQILDQKWKKKKHFFKQLAGMELLYVHSQ